MDEPTAMLPPLKTVALSEMLAAGPLRLHDGLEILAAIAEQLSRLHANNKAHGRLTPSVIRVQTFETGAPAVIFQDPADTADMSQGADQYALGTIAFQVLTGRVPTRGESLAGALPEAAGALDKLVMRLLAPLASDRSTASGAARQFADLAAALQQPVSQKAGAVLMAPPLIKRGIPIGIQPTAAHAWVQEGTQVMPPRADDPSVTADPDPESTRAAEATNAPPAPPARAKPAPNPFSDDEATATVRMPSLRDNESPETMRGPPLDDEATQYSAPKKNPAAPKRSHTKPPPPVPTPAPEVTAEPFEPSRSDLPIDTGEHLMDPRLNPRRKKKEAVTPMQQLLQSAQRQPVWVWGAVGIGLAFFVLLLIALAR